MELEILSENDDECEDPVLKRKARDDEFCMKLKAAVHYNVGKLCENQGRDDNLSFSKTIIAALTETTWKQCGVFGKDLELFARHAKRATICPDDVRLLARRSPSVCSSLSDIAEEISRKVTKKKSKKPRLDKDAETDIVLIDQ